ncbi:MAG TPA: hypothetical protein DEP66_04840, partial [Acidimicrobiaceae bacterium]|nr:hypothetical protein [Acidimicrobiaceae bacterium]
LDGGSNSWAIHGSRTAGGMPLLAGDPHRGLEFPNVYHQCHLRCDEFDAVGLAFAGVPALPHFGHNEHLAWCVTHGMADDTDAFVETAAALERVSWRAETIDVAGADPVEVRCGSTAHGPVVFGDADDGVALSVMWTGVFETDTTFDALAPMLRARSVGEMRDAVRPWVIPVNNLLLADRRGDIAYQMRGRLVERPPAARWTPVPADGSNSWAGRVPVPFDDLPAALNPAEGFIVTANNRTSDAGPYVSIDFAGPARRDRIVELLADLDAADVDDMAAVHADVTSLTAPKVIAVLIEHATHCRHPAAADVLAELRDWDCRVTAESTQASVYAVVRRRWAQRVASRLAAAGPVEYPTHSRPGVLDRGHHIVVGATTLLLDGTWSVLPGLRDGKEIFHEMSDCVDGAIEELSLRLGSDRAGWHWSRLHEMASAHPLGVAGLDPPTAGVAGDGDTVRSAGVALETGELAATGSVARYAFDLADWDRSGWVVPHGVSGVRHSGHDLDQREAWLAVELLPMLYSDAAVAAHTESVHRL